MKKETTKTTTNSSVYNRLLKLELLREYSICPICSPNGGCNWGRGIRDNKCWKTYREKQYKEKKQ